MYPHDGTLKTEITEITEIDFSPVIFSLVKYNYIETADISKDNPKLVLYQLGILTIKDVIGEAYRLGFPNREVNRTALGGFQIISG